MRIASRQGIMVLILLSSCTSLPECVTVDDVLELVRTCDRATVTFFGWRNGEWDTNYTRIDISGSDLTTINHCISPAEAQPFKCGYHGRIEFSKTGRGVITTVFSLQKNARYLYFSFDNRYYYRKLSGPALALLTSLYHRVFPEAGIDFST